MCGCGQVELDNDFLGASGYVDNESVQYRFGDVLTKFVPRFLYAVRSMARTAAGHYYSEWRAGAVETHLESGPRDSGRPARSVMAWGRLSAGLHRPHLQPHMAAAFNSTQLNSVDRPAGP